MKYAKKIEKQFLNKTFNFLNGLRKKVEFVDKLCSHQLSKCYKYFYIVTCKIDFAKLCEIEISKKATCNIWLISYSMIEAKQFETMEE